MKKTTRIAALLALLPFAYYLFADRI